MTTRKSIPAHDTLNLDCMSIEELKRLRRGKRLSTNQKTYALCKVAAMRARLRGDITSALHHERLCEQVFGTMPANERW